MTVLAVSAPDPNGVNRELFLAYAAQELALRLLSYAPQKSPDEDRALELLNQAAHAVYMIESEEPLLISTVSTGSKTKTKRVKWCWVDTRGEQGTGPDYSAPIPGTKWR